MSQLTPLVMTNIIGDLIQIDADTGSAVPNGLGVITLAGGSNINTSAVLNTVTINVDTIINLPDTNSAGTQGIIQFNSINWIHTFDTSGLDTNTFIGKNAGNLTASGTMTNNIGIGENTLGSLNNGTHNVAVGSNALANADGSLSAVTGNVAVGESALTAIVNTASENVAVGDSALSQLTSGSFNTCVGKSAGSAYTGSESYNICIGSDVTGTLGENNVMRLGALTGAPTIATTHIGGNNLQPLNSAFSVQAADQNNVTGDGTLYTVTFTAGEDFDQNGNFVSPTFTAPVTGIYLFSINISVSGIASSAAISEGQIRLVTTARTYILFLDNKLTDNSVHMRHSSSSCNAHLTAGDTAEVQIIYSGGTKVVGIVGSGTFFTGCLIA